jgi:HK97 family phage major capsid protein
VAGRPDFRSEVEIESRLEVLRGELSQINKRYRGERFPDEVRERWNSIVSERDELEAQLTEVRQRRSYLASLAGDPTRSENVDDRWSDRKRNRALVNGRPELSEALRSNEQANLLPERAQAHMERMLREDDDRQHRLALYAASASDEHYRSAFIRWMRDPDVGPSEWTDPERRAVQRVRELDRAMNITTGSAGQFMLPYELDPALLLTASYISPLRELARVETIAVNEKRFVTTAGSTSSWDPESTEVSDDQPVLAQPSVTCKKGATHVQVTFELSEDTAVVQELQKVFVDSRANLEAASYLLTQSNGPTGLISSLVSGASSVIALGTNVFAAADIFTLQGTLPARWRPKAKVLANIAVINAYRQLPVATNINESLVNIETDPPRINGWPLYEAGAMDGTLNASAADYTVVAGDMKQFAIVDRIGSSVEPNLVMGANRRPTGERGYYHWWRTGSDVLIQDAFRLLNHSG